MKKKDFHSKDSKSSSSFAYPSSIQLTANLATKRSLDSKNRKLSPSIYEAAILFLTDLG